MEREASAERMITPGQIVTLTIEKPAAGGRMIARLDGRIALVGGAIPGERVRVRIERVAKGVVYGDTIEVEEASADRRPFVDPSCGGCLYGHIAYPRQLAIKAQVIEDAFRRIGRLALPSVPGVAASPEDGYRMRARLHAGGGRIGFFREGTHAVCDPRHTRQLLPATCETVEALEQTIHSVGLDEIREIVLSENVDASERVVFVDAASAIDAGAMESLAATPGLTGCVSAFGSSGSPSVIDRVTVADGVEVALRRHVLAFFQGNRHLLAPFVAHVVGLVPTSGRLLDLYAGVGLFAVGAAAARGVEVTAVEGDRVAAADLASNAASAAGPVEAVHQSVEDFVAARARGEPLAAVIADPPRTGMSREALDGIVAHRPARAIYVSCDVATLARDARRLVDAGYAVSRIDAFDLFPNTPHVETVVVFDRTTQG
jgi:23S rRNA (uracil1939-C5)-methyltransferase